MMGDFVQNEPDNPITCTYMLQKSKRWEACPWDPEVFIEPRIPNQFYNTCDPDQKRPMAHMYTRRPMRQYRRGICHDNSALYSVMVGIVQSYGIYPYRGDTNLEDFDIIKRLFRPVYPVSPGHALEQVRSCGSVALCPEFGLAAHPVNPEGVVVINRNNHFIGEIVDKNLVIHFKPFFQEATDIVRKRRLDLTVCEATK